MRHDAVAPNAPLHSAHLCCHILGRLEEEGSDGPDAGVASTFRSIAGKGRPKGRVLPIVVRDWFVNFVLFYCLIPRLRLT